MKKLLYLEDLYNFYVSQNKSVKFSSKDSDTTIVVHIDEPLTFGKEDMDDLNMICPIRLCHTEDNVNKSTISKKSMKEAIPSAYNMPILGFIYKDDSGEYQFAGHEFFVNEDNEIEYEEIPIGTIPESAGLELVYDKDMDKTYLDGNGIIWRTYSKAADIIEREQILWCSVELVVDELSFDSKNKLLVIDKFRFSGVTILGKDRETGKEIKPGMVGSNISIADFSEKNNSIFSNNEKVIELLSALNEKIDNLNINEISKEGGKPVKKEFDEELIVAEDEVKDAPSATFDGDDPEGTDYYDESGDGEGGDPDPEPEPEPEPTPEPEPDDEGDDDDDEDDEGEGGLTIPLGQRDDDDTAGSTKKYSISVTDGEKTLDFSVSLQAKIEALYTLVNDTYSEQDGVLYDCEVFDEEKYIIMSSWWTNAAYKQSYKVKKDVYSLVGDRVPVKAVWCTEDEQKALENMRANYAALESKVASYEAEPSKMEVLSSECYAQIADTDEFKKLSEQDTHFEMSVEEVQAKADEILLAYAKDGKVNFSEKSNDKAVDMVRFGTPSKKSKSVTKGRYGGLFSK